MTKNTTHPRDQTNEYKNLFIVLLKVCVSDTDFPENKTGPNKSAN